MTWTGLTIPFNGLKKQYNNLRSEILDVTDEVLRSGQLMDGNYTVEFENWLAKKNKSKYAVTCHSGTQALEAIAEYLRQHHKQKTIIIPALTYPATVNAFLRSGYANNQIKIHDVNRYGVINLDYQNLNLEESIIVAVGLYGHSIQNYLDINKKYLIEDAAQHWLADNSERSGMAAAISFDPTKNLPNYGNGGAVVTNEPSLVEHVRNWRSNSKPHHQTTGTNSRMSEVDCAQMMIKTRYIDNWQSRRKQIAKHWIEIFSQSGIRCLIDDSNFKNHGFQKFVIDIDDRNVVQEKLAVRKIETRIHYQKPLFELPAYQEYSPPMFLSNASSLCRRVLSLPFYPELTDLEVEYIAEQVVNSTR
jgi:dTDP-4-amino-4,6-dideoxygalactose transaminase